LLAFILHCFPPNGKFPMPGAFLALTDAGSAPRFLTMRFPYARMDYQPYTNGGTHILNLALCAPYSVRAVFEAMIDAAADLGCGCGGSREPRTSYPLPGCETPFSKCCPAAISCSIFTPPILCGRGWTPMNSKKILRTTAEQTLSRTVHNGKKQGALSIPETGPLYVFQTYFLINSPRLRKSGRRFFIVS